jgi:pimeloyl-ACP methyl ester carboxylesterase
MEAHNNPTITHHTIPREPAKTRAAGEVRERLLAGLPVTERLRYLNDVVTAVLEGGSGAPIVLLHGPGAFGAAWLRVIPSLVTTHRVIAPDLPGHGASAAFDGAPDIDRICAWLDKLLEQTCAVAPVLVGHTLGGAIAARYASRRGERLAALVLVDTLGLTAFQPAPEFGSALNEFLAAPAANTQDRLWSQCLFDLPAVSSRLGEQWELIKAYSLAGAQTPEGIAALVALMEQFGIPAIPPAALAGIAVPTTLIWGRHDRATPLSAAEQACARYRWDLHVIDGAADDPTLDQPEAFLSALRQALDAR